nr:hypothetical protein [uncultured Blautia sp.]
MKYQNVIGNCSVRNFLAGRRRVGKTYLICEYFNQQFSFYTTGLSNEKTKGQLRAFQASLNAYGYE